MGSKRPGATVPGTCMGPERSWATVLANGMGPERLRSTAVPDPAPRTRISAGIPRVGSGLLDQAVDRLVALQGFEQGQGLVAVP